MTQLLQTSAAMPEISPDIQTGLVLMYPGQGHLAFGIKSLFDNSEAARSLINYTREKHGIDALQVGADRRAMADTRNMQVVTTLNSLCVTAALREQMPDIELFGATGSSLGEYAMLVQYGMLTPEQAIDISELRGRLTIEVKVEGVMIAVRGLKQAAVKGLCKAKDVRARVWPSNDNAPEETVISGDEDAANSVADRAQEEGGTATKLRIAGAFHSPKAQPLANRFREEFKEYENLMTGVRAKTRAFSTTTARQIKSFSEGLRIMYDQFTQRVRGVETNRNIRKVAIAHGLGRLVVAQLGSDNSTVRLRDVPASESIKTGFMVDHVTHTLQSDKKLIIEAYRASNFEEVKALVQVLRGYQLTA